MAIVNTIVGFDQLWPVGREALESLTGQPPTTPSGFDLTQEEATEFGRVLTELQRAQKHREILSFTG